MTSLISASRYIPPQAQAAGFTRLAYFQDFRDLSKIDLLNTKDTSKDWFIDFAWPSVAGGSTFWTNSWFDFAPLDPSHLSAVSAALHSTQGGAISLNNIASAAYISGTPGYIGQSFGPGGYWEAKMKYGTVSTFGTGFYMFPRGFFTGTESVLVEVDICEGVNATTAQTNLITWDVTTGPPPGRILHDVQFSYSGASYERHGFLWKTKAQNGGTGIFNFWRDNVKNGSDYTYTTGGDFSVMDTHDYFVFFASEGTMDIDYFAYWTTPS